MALNIIYIAGYGRSGSTLLDIILGNHNKIASGGELTYLFENLDDINKKCSCGNHPLDCEFWGKFLKRFNWLDYKDISKILYTVEKRNLTCSWDRRISALSNVIINEYKDINLQIFNYIASNYQNEYIVDSSKSSSKSSFRALALKEICNLHVKVIHLQRNFKSVLKSVFNKGNRQIEGLTQGINNRWIRTLKAIPGYTFANFCSRKYCDTFEYIHISFENLIRDTEIEIIKISEFLDIDPTPIINKIPVFETNYHIIDGNRLRFDKKIYLNR